MKKIAVLIFSLKFEEKLGFPAVNNKRIYKLVMDFSLT